MAGVLEGPTAPNGTASTRAKSADLFADPSTHVAYPALLCLDGCNALRADIIGFAVNFSSRQAYGKWQPLLHNTSELDRNVLELTTDEADVLQRELKTYEDLGI